MREPFDKEHHTVGDLGRGIMAISEPADAAAFYQDYLSWLRKQADLSDTPEAIARANIGWFFGEGMPKDRIAMWNEVCGAAHPIFGAMATAPNSAGSV